MIKIFGINTILRLVNIEDAEFIVRIRNDTNLNKYLNPIGTSIKNQIAWLGKYFIRKETNVEYYFIICDYDYLRYGTVRIYNLNNDSFSWGSWILNNNSLPSMGIESALLVYEFAFNYLKLEYSSFEVRKENLKIIAFHKRFGAKISSEDQLTFNFIYKKSDFSVTKKKYSKFLPSQIRFEVT